MAAAKQTFANHARYVPLYHFVAIGLLVACFVHAGYVLVRHPSGATLFQWFLTFGVLLLAWYARAFALTVQDRVIRLEMSLRVARLAPELAARFTLLTPGQFTALRFAGDEELPALLRAVLEGKLTRSADIKQRITNWQADELRA